MKNTIRFTSSLTLLAALGAVGPALAFHEDDPKLLDRLPAYDGPGWLPGAPAGFDESFVCGADSVPPVEFRSEGAQLLSWMPLPSLDGSASGNDCWGYVSPSGREYALMGTNISTVVVEITDPTFPQVVATIAGPTSLWRDIKTYDHYAYSVSEGGRGIQVLDLDQVDQGIVTLVREVTVGGTSATHNVAIDEESGFLYRCGGGSYGLRIYSLADPSNPSFVASWSDIYVHDAQVVTYTSGPYAGREIAFVCGGFSNGSSQTRVDILDVTDKQNIFLRSRVTWPKRAYAHQVWLSPDRQYAYINDELDEGPAPTTTYVADVSDLDSAFLAGQFTNDIPAIGHNLYTKGDFIYEANYKSGLRVFDTSSDPINPTEVRYFDTWPGNNHFGFSGLWSVYPYFPSGVVIGSDLEKGLFVLWMDDPLVEISYPSGIPLGIDPNGDTVLIQMSERSLGDLDVNSAELHFDAGAGCVTVPMNSLGGGVFEANFPPTECGNEIRWYVSGRSTNGITWRSPDAAPRLTHKSFSGQSVVSLFEDDAETDKNWTFGAEYDTATAGFWERSVPPGGRAAPNIDHTEVGTQCFHTAEVGDVDDGRTSLITPLLDFSSAQRPYIDYWRWYSKRLGLTVSSDRFRIGITNDDGANWVNVETVGIGNNLESLLGWFRNGFFVEDFVEPTDQVRVRFMAKDLGDDNRIEAAVDDFFAVDVQCGCPAAVNVCATSPNSAGAGAVIGSTGSTNVGAADFGLTVTGAIPNGTGLFYYGPSSIQVPFGDGFRCAGGTTKRLFPLVNLDGSGDGAYALDFASPPVGSGPNMITPGSAWTFQFWYRDNAAGGAGFNLSDGLRATFCE